jgi:hypothetical protein
MRSNGLALVVKKTLKHPKADDLLKAEFEAKRSWCINSKDVRISEFKKNDI